MIRPQHLSPPEVTAGAVMLPLDAIDADPKPWHSRGKPSEEEVEAFAAMLRAGEPIRHPILVRPHPQEDGRYELVFGTIRYWGANRAGRATMLATIEELSDAEASLASIGENEARANVPYLQLGWSALPLAEAPGALQKQIAERAGCREQKLSEALRYARAIPKDRAKALAERHGHRVEVLHQLSRPRLRAIARLASWEDRERELNEFCRSAAETHPQCQAAPTPASSSFEVERRGDRLSITIPQASAFTILSLIRLYLQVARELWRVRTSSPSSPK